MKRQLRLPAVLAVCALAGALGFSAGWWIQRRGLHQSAPGPATAEKFGAETEVARPKPLPAEAGAHLKSLEAQLAISPPVERWLRLIAAVEKAGPEDMPGLLQMCAGDKTALQMVAAHWAATAPAHMWQVIVAEARTGKISGRVGSLPMPMDEITEVLFKAWVTSDLKAAKNALSENSEMPHLDATRSMTFSIFTKADPEGSLELIEKWNIRHIIPFWTGLDKWAEKDPRRAAETAARSGTELAAMEALNVIGRTWSKKNPAEAMAYAAALPAAQRSSFAAGAMKEWASKDTAAAAAFAASQTDPAFRAVLAKPLVEAWAKSAPNDALAWSLDNLRGEARSKAVAGVVEGVAQKDTAAAASLVGSLEPGGAKNSAAGALALKWFHKSGPEPVIEWLSTLPDADTRRAGMEQIQWNWQMRNPAAVAAFLTGPHASLANSHLVQNAAAEQARRDPEAAMEWTGKLPSSILPMAREEVLQTWVQSRPEAAAAWLLKQPPAERTALLASAASRFTSPEALSPFLSGLSAADRTVVRNAVTQNNSLDAARKDRLLQAINR
jgi:hypothetical protein